MLQKETKSVDTLKELIYKEKLTPPAIIISEGRHFILFKNLSITISEDKYKVEKEKQEIGCYDSEHSLVEFLKTY